MLSNFEKYKVTVEFNNDPRSWKSIEVFASSKQKAMAFAEKEFEMDHVEGARAIFCKIVKS